jgi:hypothetical protein
MKKFFLLLLPLLAFTGAESLQPLNGAYVPLGTPKGPAQPGTDVTLLFDGHWVQFGNRSGTGSIRGGTFGLKEGRYYQQTGYCSTGSGNELRVFEYSLKGGKLWRGPAGSRPGNKSEGEYIRRMEDAVSPRHGNLEGVWQLEGFGINGNCAKDKAMGVACLQYNVYPMFVRVSYQVASGEVLGVVTGRYTYDYSSATCSQTVEYSSSPEIQAGQVLTSGVILHDNSFELATPGPNPSQLWISATAH